MPSNKKIHTLLKEKDKKKSKKVEPESSGSSSESESGSSESDSEYKPSSPSNGSRTNSASNEDDDTVYTECNSGEEQEQSDSEEEDEKFDNKKFQKTIAKMFPSKYSKAKAKEANDKDNEQKEQKNRRKKHHSQTKKKSKKMPESDSDEDEREDEWSADEDSESNSEPEKKSPSKSKSKTKSTDSKKPRQRHNKKSAKQKRKSKIDDSDDDDSDYSETEPSEKRQFLILSVGGDDEEDEFYDEDDDEVESLTEDTTEEFDSDAEKTFMGEAYETVAQISPKKESKKKTADTKSSSKNKHTSTASKKDAKTKDPKHNPKEEEDLHPIPANVEDEYKEMLDVRKMLLDQLKRRPNNKFLKSSLDECNSDIKKLTRKARHENTNAYYKLVNSDKKQTNEIDYFKHRLSNKDQQGIMADLKEINSTIYSEKPYRLSILQSKIPSKFKALAMQRLNMLKSMEPGDHEYYKIKNWVDAFMRIPFGVYRNIHIKMTDGIDICNEFMESAKKTLDDCVYGLNDAKLQIMQMLGQWIVNPDSVGTSIAIHGPPGTGKTSIVKDGISKILGREFAFIALGGCGDGSFLEGHSYTY